MLSLAGTLTVTRYDLVAPLSAVTRTVSVLSPVRRPVAPDTTTEEVEAVAVATTVAVVVPGATVTTLSTGAVPLIVNAERVTSVERTLTFKVTV